MPRNFTNYEDWRVIWRDYPVSLQGWYVKDDAYDEIVAGPFELAVTAERFIREADENFTPDWPTGSASEAEVVHRMALAQRLKR